MNLGLGLNIATTKSGGGLLTPFDSVAPTAGYSLRNLGLSYSGAVVRVRKDITGSPEEDFTAGQITNGTLSDFLETLGTDAHSQSVSTQFEDLSDVSLICDCNSGGTDELDAFDALYENGFVSKWYDQFGSNDATQTTAAEQPKIWDASTGLVTENGKPALDFDGSDDVLVKSGGVIGSSDLSVFTKITIDDYRITGPAFHTIVSQGTHSSQDFGCYIGDGSVESYSQVLISDSETTRFEYDSGVKDLGETILSFIGKNLFQQISKDGAVLATNTESGFDAGGTQDLFIGNDGGSRSFLGNMQEMILYASDQSANRTKIEDNINDYYDVY